VDLKVAQNYVGHKNAATTLIYAKTDKEEALR
jgi:site-specific recombinase XerD